MPKVAFALISFTVAEMRWEIAHLVEGDNEKNRADKRAIYADAHKSYVAYARF